MLHILILVVFYDGSYLIASNNSKISCCHLIPSYNAMINSPSVATSQNSQAAIARSVPRDASCPPTSTHAPVPSHPPPTPRRLPPRRLQARLQAQQAYHTPRGGGPPTTSVPSPQTTRSLKAGLPKPIPPRACHLRGHQGESRPMASQVEPGVDIARSLAWCTTRGVHRHCHPCKGPAGLTCMLN